MEQWVTVWNQSHANLRNSLPRYDNRTMLLTVRIPVRGTGIRIHFSNQAGETPFTIVQAAIYLDGNAKYPVSICGDTQVEMEVGRAVYSDVIDVELNQDALLSVAVAFRGEVTSGNCFPCHIRCSAEGNYVDCLQEGFTVENTQGMDPVVPVISAIDVLTDEDPRVIVCFGDSITSQSTWTQPLERFLNTDTNKKTIVLNQGIGGNRLLSGPNSPEYVSFGIAGVERFKRDIFHVKGTTDVILAMGTNDLGWCVTAEDRRRYGAKALYAALTSMANQLHQYNIRVYAANLTPRSWPAEYEIELEAERKLLNDMLRDSDVFDDVLDFASATSDPNNPHLFAVYCDCGDQLHPSTLGGECIARYISDREKHRCN